MAYSCDSCSKVFASGFRINGWYGRGEYDRVKPLTQPLEINIDLCSECFPQGIRLNKAEDPRVAREKAMAKYLKENPEKSSMTALRETVPIIKDILCDSCKASCFDKHLLAESRPKEDREPYQEAHLCEKCSNLVLDLKRQSSSQIEA